MQESSGSSRSVDEEDGAQLVGRLQASMANKASRKGRASRTTHTVRDSVTGVTHKIDSWKLEEQAYKSQSAPTLVRGLFTEALNKGGRSTCRIVARGYDKFFNIGEVPWTTEAAIRTFSTAPWEVTFKENGCIIFITALSPRSLLITSKHSMGENPGRLVSHAQMGEHWLDRHLASKGKGRQDLACTLWEKNMTAVAEVSNSTTGRLPQFDLCTSAL
jgi:tRNA ligase